MENVNQEAVKAEKEYRLRLVRVDIDDGEKVNVYEITESTTTKH